MGQRLLHPSHHVWKTYRAIVDGRCLDGDLEPLRRGLTLDDGLCQPARCRVLEPADARIPGFSRLDPGTTAVEVIIREGRKNQVKRMLSKIGHPVIALHRCRFGELRLGDLAEGSWRELTDEEVASLKSAPRLDL